MNWKSSKEHKVQYVASLIEKTLASQGHLFVCTNATSIAIVNEDLDTWEIYKDKDISNLSYLNLQLQPDSFVAYSVTLEG